MILADTNIFIDFWNDSRENLSEVFEKEDIKLCYVREGTYSLRTGRSTWDVEIWIRKK